MAKFSINIYDVKTGEVAKTYTREFMPTSLYIRFQKLSEKVAKEEQDMSETDLFADLCELFVELFPEMTAAEYMDQTDMAEIFSVWQDVLTKSHLFSAGKRKN